MKKLLMILLVGVFITACSSNDETDKNTNSTENDDNQATENIETEDEQADKDKDKANKKESKETETNNSNENDSELTEDEAKEQLIDYMKENKKEYIDGYDILMEKEGDKYRANIYPTILKDEGRGPSVIASYEIDRVTGEV